MDVNALSDVEQIAQHLEAEVPYSTCSQMMNQAGWIDVITTIKATCPEAYRQMQITYLGR